MVCFVIFFYFLGEHSTDLWAPAVACVTEILAEDLAREREIEVAPLLYIRTGID